MRSKTISKKNSNSTIFVYHYFFLLFGFFGGNLWGSFFSSAWGTSPSFFLVIGILLCLETLSYIYYKNLSLLPLDKKKINGARQRLFFWIPRTTKALDLQDTDVLLKNNTLEQSALIFFTKTKKKFSLKMVQNRNKSLYLLKVGLVLGLFVDAFKVGS